MDRKLFVFNGRDFVTDNASYGSDYDLEAMSGMLSKEFEDVGEDKLVERTLLLERGKKGRMQLGTCLVNGHDRNKSDVWGYLAGYQVDELKSLGFKSHDIIFAGSDLTALKPKKVNVTGQCGTWNEENTNRSKLILLMNGSAYPSLSLTYQDPHLPPVHFQRDVEVRKKNLVGIAICSMSMRHGLDNETFTINEGNYRDVLKKAQHGKYI